MAHGVKECRKTLLVLTPSYIESGWGEIESLMVQTLDPANRDLRLIPLLKAECKKPLRLGVLTHIDFTGGADRWLAADPEHPLLSLARLALAHPRRGARLLAARRLVELL
jgi:hypothetical protein